MENLEGNFRENREEMRKRPSTISLVFTMAAALALSGEGCSNRAVDDTNQQTEEERDGHSYGGAYPYYLYHGSGYSGSSGPSSDINQRSKSGTGVVVVSPGRSSPSSSSSPSYGTRSIPSYGGRSTPSGSSHSSSVSSRASGSFSGRSTSSGTSRGGFGGIGRGGSGVGA